MDRVPFYGVSVPRMYDILRKKCGGRSPDFSINSVHPTGTGVCVVRFGRSDDLSVFGLRILLFFVPQWTVTSF